MHYPINIEMLMEMAQTAGISDLSKKLFRADGKGVKQYL